MQQVTRIGGGLVRRHMPGERGKLLQFPTPATPQPQDGGPAQAYIDDHSPGASRATVQGRLNVAARLLGYDDYKSCPWCAFKRADIKRLRQRLVELVDADEYVPRYANEILLNVKAVLKEAWEQDLIDTETYHKAVAIEGISGTRRRRALRTLTEHEFKLLLLVCEIDDTARGKRDACVLAIGSSLGLRVGEIVNLTLADIDRERGLRIRKSKGGHDGVVPIAADVWVYLNVWLAIRGTEPGALFTHVTRGGNIKRPLRGLTADRLDHVLRARGDQAKIAPFSSHAMRRGAATRLIDRTGNASIAQKVLRHKSVGTTTELYYNPATDTVRDAIEKAGVPVPRPKPQPVEKAETTDAPPPLPALERILEALKAMQGVAEEVTKEDAGV